MKNRLKIMLGILLVGSLTGCTGNFEEYNTDPYAPQEPDPTMLLPTMIDAMMYVQQNNSQMIDQMVGTLGGYFTLTNRWGGQNFDTFNPSADWNQGPYNTMFLNIYGNLFEIEELSQGSGHWMAIANLIRAAVMIRVADIYGPTTPTRRSTRTSSRTCRTPHRRSTPTHRPIPRRSRWDRATRSMPETMHSGPVWPTR